MAKKKTARAPTPHPIRQGPIISAAESVPFSEQLNRIFISYDSQSLEEATRLKDLIITTARQVAMHISNRAAEDTNLISSGSNKLTVTGQSSGDISRNIHVDILSEVEAIIDNSFKEAYDNRSESSDSEKYTLTEYKDKMIHQLQDKIAELQSELSERILHQIQIRESENNFRELAEKLSQRGKLRLMPSSISPNMMYVSPRELVESGLTEYTYPHILKLLKLSGQGKVEPSIEHFEIGSHVYLPLRGVQQILDREQASLRGDLGLRGLRPGRRLPDSSARPTPSP